jgi:hypothetical protein
MSAGARGKIANGSECSRRGESSRCLTEWREKLRRGRERETGRRLEGD